MPKYYPVNLELKNKKCVVIGAGSVAKRKVSRLLECGAHVLVISPKAAKNFKDMAREEKVILRNRRVRLKDLDDAYLVIAATGERDVNSLIFSYCRKKNILINVVDSPEECSFTLPSVIRRGALTISISTDGVSPALSKKIREDLERIYGSEYAVFLRVMGKVRDKVRKNVKGQKERKRIFEKVLQSKALDLFKAKKKDEALKEIRCILKSIS